MEKENYLNTTFSGCENLIKEIERLEKLYNALKNSPQNKVYLSKCIEYSNKIKNEIESLLALTDAQKGSLIASIARNYLNEALKLINGYKNYLQEFDKLNYSNIQNLSKILELLKTAVLALLKELSAELQSSRKAA